MTNYQTENEIQRAVVEWRGAGQAVAHAADEIGNTAMAIGYAFTALCESWRQAADAVADAADAVRRKAAP